MKKFLLVGLGNPGAQFVRTRHNIGFEVVDLLAAKLGLTFSPDGSKRAPSLVAVSERDNLVLLKPQTMMNLSGIAVWNCVEGFKIPHDQVVIIADNMDVPLGAVRVTNRGGSGGQNGVTDVLKYLGKDSSFVRMKVGIGRPRPDMDPADYVLGRFNSQEMLVANNVKGRAVECLQIFMKEGLPKAMNKINGVMEEVPKVAHENSLGSTS